MTAKESIIQIVNNHQGIKGTELAIQVISEHLNISPDDFDSALAECIKNGDIVEVEYTLPMMDYRVKSLYFPKETVIVISQAS